MPKVTPARFEHFAILAEASVYAVVTARPDRVQNSGCSSGEIEVAKEGQLPPLVQLDEIHGDLHMHTTASDGAYTLEEMAGSARSLGYKYIAITDHSKSLRITNGLDEQRLIAQGRAIAKLNKSWSGFRVLKGSEVDILPDGSLDFGDEVLRTLEIVIGSIHSRFNLSRKEQTQLLLRAIENSYLLPAPSHRPQTA
jgi:DNA polymerase (family 10)